MFEYVKGDLLRKQRAYVVRPEDQTFFRKNIKIHLQQGSIAVICFRFGRWTRRVKIPVVRQLLYLLYWIWNMAMMVTSGINIQVTSDIGKGFVIHNFSCVFVWAKKMGENCTVNQGVTIGMVRGSTRPPIVGNNVYFGAGCKVLGGVTIGDNVVIAANSLVISDVPSDCTVCGVPARIVSRGVTSKYLQFT